MLWGILKKATPRHFSPNFLISPNFSLNLVKISSFLAESHDFSSNLVESCQILLNLVQGAMKDKISMYSMYILYA